MDLKNVTYAYDPKGRSGIYQLNLSLKAGKVYALMGANGAGKSTLLNLIAQKIKPQTGELSNPLTPVSFFPREQFLPTQNILTSLKSLLDPILDEEKKTNLVRDWALLLEFTSHLKKTYDELSQGNQLKVQLTASLLHLPKLLLLDEPLAHFDSVMREQFLMDLKRIAKEKEITVILCTHQFEDASKITDELIFMEYGSVIAKGPIEQLYLKPPTLTVAQLLGHLNLFSVQKINGAKHTSSLGELELPMAPDKEHFILSIPPESFQWGEGLEVQLQDICHQGAYTFLTIRFHNALLKIHLPYTDYKRHFKNNQAKLNLNKTEFLYFDYLI